MKLRLHLPSSRPPPRWSVALPALVAAALVTLGSASGPASGGVGNYGTLYLSSTPSTVVSGAYQLLMSGGPGTPAAAPVAAASGAGVLASATYQWEYTVVDPTTGETLASPLSNSLTFNAMTGSKSVGLTGLPQGVEIRLYRACSCSSNLFYKIADFTPASGSPQFVDNVPDATADVPANLLPQTQNRPPLSGLGYFEFVPGFPLQSTTATTTAVASPAFSGEGWVVDAPGGVGIAAGTWTFNLKFRGTAGAVGNTARLDIGMWIVDGTGAVVGSAVIDPTGAGENAAANIATSLGTTTAIQTQIAVPAITLQPTEHLYVQFWRHQTASISSTITTLNINDTVAKITHPTANGFPNVPTPGAVAARVNAAPALPATFTDPDAGDTGTLQFQLCSTSPCTDATVIDDSATDGNSPAGVANGGTATWTPSYPLGDTHHDGTYGWRVRGTDSFGNPASNWADGSSFVVDTVPPTAPTYGSSPAGAARVNGATLHANFTDTDAGDTGTVDFQVCTSNTCGTVVDSGSSPFVSGGATPTAVSWTATALTGTPPTTYDWRIRATDAAGNHSAWTAAAAMRTFTYDTHPPGISAVTGPADGSYTNAAPSFSAKFSANSDTGDTGTIQIQTCLQPDSSCSSPQTSSSAAGLADAAVGTVAPALADGTYYWRAQAQDAAGNGSGWPAGPFQSFTLDTQAPSVSVGAIASRVKVMPQISATYTDPAPETDPGTVTLKLCTAASCTPASVLQTSVQSNVGIGTTALWTPGSEPDGVYYWRVQAQDPAGNLSTAASGSFTVDTVPPGVPTLTSPATGARVNPVALGATFVDTDATDSGSVTFELCSDAACSTVLSTSPGSAVVTPGSDVGWTAPTPSPDGTYWFRASATDLAGNVGAWSATRSIVVDTTPPGVPTLGSVAARVSTSPQLSASFSDPDGGDTRTILFQICADSACGSVVANGSSASGLTSPGSATWTDAGLAPGSYYWRAAAEDAAGNDSAWSATGQFAFDTTPPAVPSVTGPADGARVNQPPTLGAVYLDPSAGPGDSGTLTFEICPTSTCATPLLTRTIDSLLAGSGGSWTPTLGDGTYYWRVVSQDAAGNTASTGVASFTIDQTPPAAPALLVPSGTRVQTSPALTARVDDPSDPGDSARIYVEICSDASCASVLANGYSAAVPVGGVTGWAPPSLGSGTYYWRAQAEDAVGNRSAWSDTRSFVVDDTPPAVPTGSGPADGAVVNKLQLSGDFSSSDPGDSGTLEFQLCADGECASVVAVGLAGPVVSGGLATWAVDVAAVDDGVYFWRVRAVDEAGNASPWSDTCSVTLDDTPPGPPQDFKATITGQTLTLTWRPPARPASVRGYALIVNGKKTLALSPKTLKIRIHLRAHDRRTFAIAAIDPAGNMSDATRTIATAGPAPRLSVKRVRSAATHGHG